MELQFSFQSLKVFKFLLDAPTHKAFGNEIIKGAAIKSGTLYPILARFTQHGLLTRQIEKGTPQVHHRPLRHYYSITRTGFTVGGKLLADVTLK